MQINKIFPLFFVIAFESCQFLEKKDTINIKGSDSMLPLMHKIASGYEESTGKKLHVALSGGGSLDGLAALAKGETDIAMSSVALSEQEKKAYESQGNKLTEVLFAFDDVLVIVNPDNPVSQITTEQLQKIYTGEINNWSQLGGNDAPIIGLIRDKDSGITDFLMDNVMKKAPFSTKIIQKDSTKFINQAIDNDVNAIALIGSGNFDKHNAKALDVSEDGGKTYYAPNEINVRAKYYPFIIPLYLYYVEKKNDEILPSFVNYLLSKSARYDIVDMGYVPNPIEEDSL